jgi:hypothetical protein
MFLWYPVLDLARAPRRTARKKGSGYENGLVPNSHNKKNFLKNVSSYTLDVTLLTSLRLARRNPSFWSFIRLATCTPYAHLFFRLFYGQPRTQGRAKVRAWVRGCFTDTLMVIVRGSNVPVVLVHFPSFRTS